MRGSSYADAGVSFAKNILFALDQRAEIQLVTLYIKGTFDWVWWKGLLCYQELMSRRRQQSSMQPIQIMLRIIKSFRNFSDDFNNKAIILPYLETIQQ